MADEFLGMLRGALTFNTDFFRRFHARHDVFLRGVVVVALVALIAALPLFVINLVNGLSTRGGQANEFMQQYQQALQRMMPFMQGVPPEALASMNQGFEVGSEIAARIEALPTAIPRPIGRGLEALGTWLSKPFAGARFPLAVAGFGTWLGYGVLVMLFARLLGGRGDMAGFFGTTSLYAVPHLLNVLSPVPYLGSLIGFVAFAWGAAIYVKATAVSHDITLERAVLAALLPLLVALTILIVLGIGLIVFIAIAAAGR
jgi:hypothetical protein